MSLPKNIATGMAVLMLVVFHSGCSDSNNNNNSSAKAEVMPIVFVHGQSVDPMEWFDAKWIRDNLATKLEVPIQ